MHARSEFLRTDAAVAMSAGPSRAAEPPSRADIAALSSPTVTFRPLRWTKPAAGEASCVAGRDGSTVHTRKTRPTALRSIEQRPELRLGHVLSGPRQPLGPGPYAR